ncbi:hypothetical protein B0H19DRAFT_924620, partial [Mycena capillaripes]
SCIAIGWLGWGLQIGKDITNFVIVPPSEDAVRTFSQGENVTIGGAVNTTAGPIGMGGSVESALATTTTPMFSYSKSKNWPTPSSLSAGLSLEGTVLIERKDAVRDFYELCLRGSAGGSVEIIEAAEGLDESGLPQEAYVRLRVDSTALNLTAMEDNIPSAVFLDGYEY